MTILPHHVAGVTLLGGLSVGGYFAINAVTPPTLENKLKELGVDILTNGWDQKEAEYNKATADTIDLIPKATAGKKIDDFAGKLEKWCTKRKTKPFYGPEDPNYRRFSLWCTATSNIETVLGKRKGWKLLSNDEIKGKFETYNSEANTDKFVVESSAVKVAEDLITVCNKKKAENYKYESDSEFKKVIKWCYEKA